MMFIIDFRIKSINAPTLLKKGPRDSRSWHAGEPLDRDPKPEIEAVGNVQEC